MLWANESPVAGVERDDCCLLAEDMLTEAMYWRTGDSHRSTEVADTGHKCCRSDADSLVETDALNEASDKAPGCRKVRPMAAK